MASKTGQLGHRKYSEQIVLLISKDARAVVDIAAREQSLSQAAVARAFLYAGMKAAGYTALKTTDEPGNLGEAAHTVAKIQRRAEAKGRA